MSFLPKEIEKRVDKIVIEHKLDQDEIFSLLKKLRNVSLKAMKDLLTEREK